MACISQFQKNSVPLWKLNVGSQVGRGHAGVLIFESYAVCMKGERGQNWSVVNLDSLSLSSLHPQHCIRSILLRVADTSKIHPFRYSSEI